MNEERKVKVVTLWRLSYFALLKLI